jgi:hypothetical protein
MLVATTVNIKNYIVQPRKETFENKHHACTNQNKLEDEKNQSAHTRIN